MSNVTQVQRRKTAGETVAFRVTGRSSAPVSPEKPIELTHAEAAARRFEWAREFRRSARPPPREIVLAQFIAERINIRPDDRGYGTAWASRARMSQESGLALKTVDKALAGLKHRGMITTRKMGMRGILEIQLARPESQLSRPRPRGCETPQKHSDLAHVSEGHSPTSAKYISTDISTRAQEEEGSSTSTLGTLHLRELVEMAQRVGWTANDLESLPKHVKALLASELKEGALSYEGLAAVFDRHLGATELPSFTKVQA